MIIYLLMKTCLKHLNDSELEIMNDTKQALCTILQYFLNGKLCMFNIKEELMIWKALAKQDEGKTSINKVFLW